MINSQSDSEHYVSPQAPHYVVPADDEDFFKDDDSHVYPAAVYLKKKTADKKDTSNLHYPICQIPPEKI